ncbi:uncharacterized oxidoreductase, chloroplastic [Tanacetum coccineum]
MALHFSTACNFGLSQKRVDKIKAVASDGFVKVKSDEDNLVKLGGSDLKVTKLGIGAWSWGDTSYWNNFQWDDRKMKACKNAFDASIDSGITWFDTAEVYGSRASFGAINSETLLGRFIKERKKKYPEEEIAVATKFAALPWRLGRQSVISALKDSLSRLELDSVELYQLHWNMGKRRIHRWSCRCCGTMAGEGLLESPTTVKNVNERLNKQLKARVILPWLQTKSNYSLIYRLPEENGAKATVNELGVSLIAYSPIAQGILTGKYTPQNIPTGPRGNIYTADFLTEEQIVSLFGLPDYLQQSFLGVRVCGHQGATGDRQGAKFDIEKFDGTGDFGLWRIKMRALLIQHGCEEALEVLPANMEAEAKAELNKKPYSVVILCLALDFGGVMATLNSKEFKERSRRVGDDGEGLYGEEELIDRICISQWESQDQSLEVEDSKYDGGSVLLGDNRECKIRDIGKVRVQLRDGSSFVLHNVRVVLSGTRRDNCVYSLDGHAMAGELNASVEEKDSLAQVWHKRLGHISEAGLQVLEKQGLFGKKSLGGIIGRLEVFFLSIIDDYSRRVWVYILRFKHEAFGKFKEWKQLVENQTGRTVKKLRTDNGLEFCNREFEQLCIESGIARHLTVAGTPQQNGLEVELQRFNNHTPEEDQIDQEDGVMKIQGIKNNRQRIYS